MDLLIELRCLSITDVSSRDVGSSLDCGGTRSVQATNLLVVLRQCIDNPILPDWNTTLPTSLVPRSWDPWPASSA